MIVRKKRSISLPPELSAQIEAAATEAGMSVSAWIAETAAHRLKIEAGFAAFAEWEAEAGSATPEEEAEAEAWVRVALGIDEPAEKKRGRSAA